MRHRARFRSLARPAPAAFAAPAVLPALAALLSPPPLAAQAVVKHDTENVSVTLPPGWEVGRSKPKMKPLGKDRKAYDILSFTGIPDSSARGVAIGVRIVNSGDFNIRPDVVRERVFYQSYQGVEKCDLGYEPLPHIVARQVKPTKAVLAAAYRRTIGRTVRLSVRCAASQWDDIEPAFFEMAKSMKFDLAPWPQRPGGRTEKRSDGILFSFAPAIKKRAFREVMKCATDIQKGMTEIHGDVVRPKGDPLVIYVNELKADHKRIAESRQVASVVMEPGHHRLFTVPLQERGTHQRAQFASAVCNGILSEIYGSCDALWFELGERWVADQRDRTKRKLPSVDKTLLEQIQVSMSFEELSSQKKVPTNDFPKECFAYVAVFHAGPKDYRTAYEEFLAALKATGDPDAAAKKHLLSLDQATLKADVQEFVKKLRGVRVH